MDKYSFLNALHPAQFDELYNKYLEFPDNIEPSLRAFFQGFDFGAEYGGDGQGSAETISVEDYDVGELCADVIKEFRVMDLIAGYRKIGRASCRERV